MPFATPLALSAALHLYIAMRLAPALPAPWGATLAVLLAASALLVPGGLLARRLLRPPAADRLTWVGMLALGLFSTLLVLTLLRDLLLLAAGPWGPLPPGWAMRSAAATGVLALALTAIGFLNARRTAAVRRVRIALPGLHADLEGFRIVQISDIHVGPTIKQGYLQAIVDRVNALDPDVVAVTGDLVDGSVAELAPHVAPLAGLRARHGVYFVTGNHEYYSGVHGWVRELRRLGLTVLHNEHVALRDAPANATRVLLAHQPRTAPAAAQAGFDLQLSGHTHGGQFFPWSFFVPLQQPFTAGLHQLGRMQIYVSRGTGYWGPPKRLGAPSEIAELRLSREG
jgi:predicted MPP superfamily phosphohydrolase